MPFHFGSSNEETISSYYIPFHPFDISPRVTYNDAYLRLARVCDERAKLDPADKGMWLVRAKEAAQHCQVADLRFEYTAEIDKFLAPPTQPQAKPDVLVEVSRKG